MHIEKKANSFIILYFAVNGSWNAACINYSGAVNYPALQRDGHSCENFFSQSFKLVLDIEQQFLIEDIVLLAVAVCCRLSSENVSEVLLNIRDLDSTGKCSKR